VALQRIAILIIPCKFEIGMRSRSDPQTNVIFRIAPIHDPIRQKPGYSIYACTITERLSKASRCLYRALARHLLPTEWYDYQSHNGLTVSQCVSECHAV
jgi:hypothetical protein